MPARPDPNAAPGRPKSLSDTVGTPMRGHVPRLGTRFRPAAACRRNENTRTSARCPAKRGFCRNLNHLCAYLHGFRLFYLISLYLLLQVGFLMKKFSTIVRIL